MPIMTVQPIVDHGHRALSLAPPDRPLRDSEPVSDQKYFVRIAACQVIHLRQFKRYHLHPPPQLQELECQHSTNPDSPCQFLEHILHPLSPNIQAPQND